MTKFRRRSIEVRTGTVVKEVQEGKLILQDGKEIPFGCLVWSTGLTENPMTASLEGKVLKSKNRRILTDKYLRVLTPDGTPMPNVYALGTESFSYTSESHSESLIQLICLQVIVQRSKIINYHKQRK